MSCSLATGMLGGLPNRFIPNLGFITLYFFQTPTGCGYPVQPCLPAKFQKFPSTASVEKPTQPWTAAKFWKFPSARPVEKLIIAPWEVLQLRFFFYLSYTEMTLPIPWNGYLMPSSLGIKKLISTHSWLEIVLDIPTDEDFQHFYLQDFKSCWVLSSNTGPRAYG